jgi:hypothetical protein
MKCISRTSPHHPPANTFVIQKLAATLQSSVRKSIQIPNNSIRVKIIIKHVGHTRRKALVSGSAIFHFDRNTLRSSQEILK